MKLFFLLGALFRIVLCFFNRDANDTHIEVIDLLADHGSIQNAKACFECSHARLYHGVCALLIRMFSIAGESNRILLSQTVSVVASLGTLWIASIFIKSVVLPRWVKILTFGWVALNPDLATIGVQATNDSFVIFFSVMACFILGRLIIKRSDLLFTLLVLTTLGAALSKGSGLVLFSTLSAGFIMESWLHRRDSTIWKWWVQRWAIFLFIFFAIVPFAGIYYENYVNYGSPFILPVPKDQPPHIFQNDFVDRPGVTSILNGYFTFRFVDLFEYPYVTQENNWYPDHRTSLWSQLYGRLNFSRFAQWPKTWASPDITNDSVLITLGRALFLFALFPSLLFLIGFGRSIKLSFERFRSKTAQEENQILSYVSVLFFFMYSFMLFKLNYDYRCFCAMKVIYVFPALLSGVWFFILGLENANQFLSRRKISPLFLQVPIYGLLVLFGIDLSILALDLAKL